MLIRLFIPVVVFSLLAGVACGQWTEVSLVNGDFESWTDDVVDGWELSPSIDPDQCTATGSVIRSSDSASGGSSLSLSGNAETCRWLSPLQNLPAVRPGEIYRLSGQMKTLDVDLSGQRYRNCQFFALAFDENDQRCGYFGVPTVTGTTDWTAYSTVFQIPPNAVTIKLGAFLSVPGTAWFDDLRLEKLETPTPAAEWTRAERWHVDMDYLVQLLEAFHPDPFADVSRATFQAGIDDLKKRTEELDDAALTWRLRALLCSLDDSHTGCGLPEGVGQKLPIHFYVFKKEIRIVATLDDYAELLGAQVTMIDDVPLADIVAGIRPQIAYTHESWFREQVVGWLAMPAALHGLGLIASPQAMTVTAVTLGGEIVERRFNLAESAAAAADETRWRLAGPAEDEQPLYRRDDRFYWFEYLADAQTLFMKYSRSGDDPQRPLRQFGAELTTALDAAPIERFVLDVRHNAGGSNVINSLFKELARRMADGRIGQTFVITGRRTYSAAVYDADAMRQHTGAVVVGEPTGMAPVHPGQVASFELPCSELDFSCSTKMIRASDDDSPALMPDIAVELTWADYAAGRDPALAAVLAYQKP